VAQAVVGLGNPGAEYQGTRHNVGHRVVDCLAKRLHRRWVREGPSRLARGEWNGEPLYLIKPSANMNAVGPTVARLLGRLALTSADLIIVYDDLDLPLGKVRVRLKGSHGGHNGMRSLIESLGTQQFRRVKVGIGRPALKDDIVDHVLTTFARDELPIVEAACTEAADAVLRLVAATTRRDP
jgi:PTH1 family peptidyl-tRNA hydrolase